MINAPIMDLGGVKLNLGSLIGAPVNVKAHDAEGDGVTDDTEAVQSAIDAAGKVGGLVFFPAGVYLISAPLILRYRVHLRGVGLSFMEGSDLDAQQRSTIKLADGSNCDMLKNDPNGPLRGGQDTPHTWQRSSISGIVFNGNAVNQTTAGLAALRLYRVWGVNIANCEVDFTRGTNIVLDDVNVVNLMDVTSIGGANTAGCILLKDSADCLFHGVQAGGSAGPVLLLDNSIKNIISSSFFYNAVNAGRGDEHAVYLRNNSRWNALKSIRADQSYLDGVFIDATCRDNEIEVIALENGFGNVVGRSGIRVAGSYNRIYGIAAKGSNVSQRQDYGVTVEDNADYNWISVMAQDNRVAPYSLSNTGTEHVTISPTLPAVYLPASNLEGIIGIPTLGLIGGGRRKAYMLDAAQDEMIGSVFLVPEGWGRVKLTVQWVNGGAGAGNVRWSLSGHSFVAGESLNVIDDAATSSWDVTALAGAQDVLVESASGGVGFPVIPGAAFFIRVKRVAIHVEDTLTNDVGVMGIKITKAG